jgi:hypothetical protein
MPPNTDRVPWTAEQVREAATCACGTGYIDAPKGQDSRRAPLLRRASDIGYRRRNANPGRAAHGDPYERTILESTIVELVDLVEEGRSIGVPAAELLRAAGISRQAFHRARQKLPDRLVTVRTSPDISTDEDYADPIECPACDGKGVNTAAYGLLMRAAELGGIRRAAVYRDKDTVDRTTRELWALLPEAHAIGLKTPQVAHAAGFTNAVGIYDAVRQLREREGAL